MITCCYRHQYSLADALFAKDRLDSSPETYQIVYNTLHRVGLSLIPTDIPENTFVPVYPMTVVT